MTLSATATSCLWLDLRFLPSSRHATTSPQFCTRSVDDEEEKMCLLGPPCVGLYVHAELCIHWRGFAWKRGISLDSVRWLVLAKCGALMVGHRLSSVAPSYAFVCEYEGGELVWQWQRSEEWRWVSDHCTWLHDYWRPNGVHSNCDEHCHVCAWLKADLWPQLKSHVPHFVALSHSEK